MSSENLDLARRLYPGTFDIAEVIRTPGFKERFEPLVTPDYETVGAAMGMEERETPDSLAPSDVTRRAARGVEGFIETWDAFLDAWQSWVITATDFVEVDDERVLVVLDIRGRSKTHGVEIPIDAANLLTFRGGKLARLELFTSRSAAYAAAGLAE